VGEAYKPGNGFAMVAAHIDALTAKLKPVSNKPNSMGFQQLGVAPYAGALNETWWDRDLSIGGRVVVRDAETGKTRTRLVKLDWPIARIPTLAPHFGVGMMGDRNKETQMVPIIGLESSASTDTTSAPTNPGLAKTFIASQPPKLVALIASQLQIQDHSSIVNWELELYDSQPAQVGGMDKEFIFAGRIDDKLCSWAAYMALLLADRSKDDGTVRMVALFDDEEIGSLLRQGAKGNFMSSVIDRVVESLTAHASSKAASAQPAFCTTSGMSSKSTPPPPTFGPGLVGQTLAASFLLSADVIHAINPNFISVHETAHAPRLNVGVALCADSNGHMTTDSVSTAILQRIADKSDCTLQRFIIRNDMRSGGTVGPELSSTLGVKAADAGIPQLSMHSIRATTGSLDPGLGVKFFKAFLEKYEEVDGEWT
jgi:aminopeptidase I